MSLNIKIMNVIHKWYKIKLYKEKSSVQTVHSMQ